MADQAVEKTNEPAKPRALGFPDLRDEMDRLWETVMVNPFRPFRYFERAKTMPATDVFEKDGALHIRAELPGMTDKDVEIEVTAEAVTITAIIFAAVGGRQLTASAKAMTEAVPAILGIVFTWIALPALALVAIITLVGIPLGIGVLVFLMPALWFLGFIVAGTRLGGWLIGLAGRGAGEHSFAAATVGIIILQLIVLVPVLGALVALLAGVWGAGALAVTAFRAAGGKDFSATAQGAATISPQPEPTS